MSDPRNAEKSNCRFATRRGRALRLVMIAAMLGGCASLPEYVEKQPSYVVSQDSATRLDQLYGGRVAANPENSGVRLLPHGPDAFVARAKLARLSDRSIDAQYYLWQQDTVGRLLIAEILRAADRGVRVRILIDDMYGNEGEGTWLALDAHPQIQVRLFNPFSRSQSRFWQFLTRLEDVNYRMHSKSFTVDNRAAIVGGRNIGDEYFGATPDLAFADRDALVFGTAVREVSAEFDDYWNSEHAFPVADLLPEGQSADLDGLRARSGEVYAEPRTTDYLQALDNSALARELGAGSVALSWGPGRIIHDSSQKKDRGEGWEEALLISQLAPHITSAKMEVIIVSPYFVPGGKGRDALCELAGKGVRVEVLTNSLASNDVTAVHAGYSKYRRPLLRCGVILYELNEALKKEWQRTFNWLPRLSKSSLHAKMMVFDKEKLFIGSFNFDQRSLHINNEIGLLFEQAEVAGPVSDDFNRNIDHRAFRVELHYEQDGREQLRWRGLKNGEEIVLDSEPYARLGTRIAVFFMKLLPVESQL